MTYNNHQSNPIHPSDRIPTYRKTEKKTRIKKIKKERKKKKKKKRKKQKASWKNKKKHEIGIKRLLKGRIENTDIPV